MTSKIVAKAVPSGGVITLTIASPGNMTLSRAVETLSVIGPYTQLYSGPWVPFYIDAGDQLPGPLDGTQNYVYQLVDANGTRVTPVISPTRTLAIQTDALTSILVRTIQGAVSALYLPGGVKRATVSVAMPIAGLPSLPLITVNLNLLQQKEIPVGQSAWVPDNDGNIIISGFAERSYQVSVLSLNSPERDFYRDALIGIFDSFIGAILQPMGIDVTHSYQISSGQVAKDNTGMGPGFYYADCMLDFTGILNVTISTNYGYIEQIDFTAYSPDGVATTAHVPITIPIPS